MAPAKWMEVQKLLGNSQDLWWWLKDAPKGSVDAHGFLTFTGRTISILQVISRQHRRNLYYREIILLFSSNAPIIAPGRSLPRRKFPIVLSSLAAKSGIRMASLAEL